MDKDKKAEKPGYHLIFRWTYRHPRTGKIIRATIRPFPIWVKD
jgi:hypothetical protein